ncbi:MAG TPA: NAD(P)-binding domain-containing protein [Chitinophagaceae bacterium]
MKIGILGSGEVGQTLASAFLAEGHDVMLGTRNTDKPEVQQWKAKNKNGAAGTFAETAQFGELLVLAVSGDVAEKVVGEAGKGNFDGKVVIDTTNPIKKAPPENGLVNFFTTLDSSLMEQLQKAAPDAKFVKAFNSIGSDLMYKPKLKGGEPTMFICGDDASAKQTVTAILESFGFEVEDMGAATSARAIEPLCILWCIPGFLKNQWTHAFKLLKP